MRIVLVHGWAFSPAMWDAVRDELPHETLALDLGFFGPPAITLPEDEPLLAVGHSLGLLWLLMQKPLPMGSRILGINGFTRFSRATDFPAGVAPRVLDRMLAGLERNAEDVLRQFRANCGVPVEDPLPEDDLSVERLAQGLQLLRDGDGRVEKGRIHAFLASRDDAIVTPDMTAASMPSGRIRWSEKGGHLLPLSNPALCARFISEMADV
ncbi:alpha/beta fold hydrolase [Acetobacter conturbans]|uniref:Alpha/beta hydrolase n=1 Tax=Acetobacter conturbans TaxID=1737472 RepID=A0ABX0JZ58_9PROT|nr:alpha/beta fold hydrolase [Acetobacter conturbans]NHN87348.1 alpha/beta hydrolase [Acetobacter conturbans]